MSYFSDSTEKSKLYILYVISSFSIELTASQIARVIIDSGLIGYYELMLLLGELESDKLIASVPCRFGPGYKITPIGEDYLKMFKVQLPLSVREDCDKYVLDNKERILNSERLYARNWKDKAGSNNSVVLSSFEGEKILLSITLSTPDGKRAEKLCENWKNRSAEVYEAICEILEKD